MADLTWNDGQPKPSDGERFRNKAARDVRFHKRLHDSRGGSRLRSSPRASLAAPWDRSWPASNGNDWRYNRRHWDPCSLLSGGKNTASSPRSSHQAILNGRGRPVIIIRRATSFWQGSQSPAGPVLQIHIQGVLTNPNVRRALVISRLEVFRLTRSVSFQNGNV